MRWQKNTPTHIIGHHLLLWNNYRIIMNQTLIEILRRREDLSDFVFHFTKGFEARETLKKILNEGQIKDKGNNGYICFSDSPLTMLAPMFDLFERYINPMYAPYGIGIKKKYLYDLKARPVYYYDPDDGLDLSIIDSWRLVKYVPEKYDFTWLREWRCPQNSINLTYDDCFVVVKTNSDILEMNDMILELDDIDIDAQPEDGGIRTEYTGYFTRKFKAVSLEEISIVSQMNKEQLRCTLNEQSNQDSHYLGSTCE